MFYILLRSIAQVETKFHGATAVNADLSVSSIVSKCRAYLLPTQDAGLENMALEVGTVQGGQIAALQDGKDGALGKPTGCPKVAFVGCPIPLLRTCVWWSGDNLEHGRQCRIIVFRRRTLASSEAAL